MQYSTWQLVFKLSEQNCFWILWPAWKRYTNLIDTKLERHTYNRCRGGLFCLLGDGGFAFPAIARFEEELLTFISGAHESPRVEPIAVARFLAAICCNEIAYALFGLFGIMDPRAGWDGGAAFRDCDAWSGRELPARWGSCWEIVVLFWFHWHAKKIFLQQHVKRTTRTTNDWEQSRRTRKWSRNEFLVRFEIQNQFLIDDEASKL